MPAAPASPWTSRSTSSTVIDQANAQASEASAYATSPIISGRLRPKRSDSGPAMIWPTARPIRHAVMVSCAAEVDASSSAASWGSAGR